ncbi:hypothetical protein WJX84_008946 [Apatococcus fuscideae]|uniref:Uncharacterized protein n=1 Tax=Apatococcus fuscideae TaxID=2026836 RepID=A0AAW1SZH1_9CHLO
MLMQEAIKLDPLFDIDEAYQESRLYAWYYKAWQKAGSAAALAAAAGDVAQTASEGPPYFIRDLSQSPGGRKVSRGPTSSGGPARPGTRSRRSSSPRPQQYALVPYSSSSNASTPGSSASVTSPAGPVGSTPAQQGPQQLVGPGQVSPTTSESPDGQPVSAARVLASMAQQATRQLFGPPQATPVGGAVVQQPAAAAASAPPAGPQVPGPAAQPQPVAAGAQAQALLAPAGTAPAAAPPQQPKGRTHQA